MKPFKLPWSSDSWSSDVGTAGLSSLVIPARQNESLQDVKERLHMEFLASNTFLEKLAEERRLGDLLADASLKNFVLVALSFADAEHEAFAKTLAGIDVPEKLYESLRHETTLAATRMYHRLAEKIAVGSMAELNKKEKQKEKEARALEEAAKLPVEEVVRRSFMDAMKKRDGKKFQYDKYPNIVDFMSMLTIELNEPVLRPNASTSSSGVPKNEVSPGGGQGAKKQGHRASGKAVSKVAPKAAPKSQAWSAKGGSKGKSKSRGSGKKGKGKGGKA